MTRTFCLALNIPAQGQMGAVRTTDVDTITETERDGAKGVLVATRITGTVEGSRVDRRFTRFHPGVTMTAAAAYRLTHGWTEIAS